MNLRTARRPAQVPYAVYTVQRLKTNSINPAAKVEADLDAKLKAAQSLRQAILRHAFSGQLVPQDPNDEPASELLKRIAVERSARLSNAATARRRPSAQRVAEVEDFVDFLAAREGDGQASRLTARASEAAFGAVWDNTEDAEYDTL